MKIENVEKFIGAGSRPLIWIVLIILLVYGQTIGFGFTGYDDDALISNNTSLAFSVETLARLFGDDVMQDQHGLFYRPLLGLSYMIDHALSGREAWGYHLANVLYHSLAVILLFRLLLMLAIPRQAAFFTVMFFAVHPVLTQAVAWLPGRNDILLMIFVLLAYQSFVHFALETRAKSLAGHAAWLLAAFLTKETAVIIPLVCFAGWFLLLRRDVPLRKIRLIAPVWAGVFVLWAFLRSRALADSAGLQKLIFFSPSELLAGWMSYLGKIFFPLELAVYPVVGYLPVTTGVLALLLLLLMAWLAHRPNRNLALFGVLWFFLFLAPTIVRGTEDAAFLEHRLYVPLAGLAIFINALKPWRGLSRRTLALITGAVFILFTAQTVLHSRVFSRDELFWRAAVSRAPNSAFVYYGRANSALRHGDEQAAEYDYQKALSLRPGFVRASYNLGNLYVRRGELRKAAAAYRQALQAAPYHLDALVNLAIVYRKLGRAQEALQILKKAEAVAPANAVVQANLASLMAESDGEEAEAVFQRIIREKPDDPAVYFNYGNFLQKQGRWRQAAAQYRQAVRLDSSFGRAWSNLGVSLARAGEMGQAEKALLTAVRLEPESGEAHANLALLYLGLNRKEEARKHAERAAEKGRLLPEAARKALR